jgi:hypothetical protein
MAGIIGFTLSIGAIYFNGDVDDNDAIRAEYSYLSDRVRCWVQGTEQDGAPVGNWFAMWGA